MFLSSNLVEFMNNLAKLKRVEILGEENNYWFNIISVQYETLKCLGYNIVQSDYILMDLNNKYYLTRSQRVRSLLSPNTPQATLFPLKKFKPLDLTLTKNQSMR